MSTVCQRRHAKHRSCLPRVIAGVFGLGQVLTGLAGFMRTRRRKPTKGSKSTTDPAAIAWRNLSPEQKAKGYGRWWFIEQFNAGLIDAKGRPTGTKDARQCR